MAPEVTKPGWTPTEELRLVPYDHRCDVYSFGILLWEIVHEMVPFGERPGLTAAIAASQGERPPTTTLACDRERLVPLIKGCWSHEAADRPEMNQVVETLRRLKELLED